MNLIIRKSVESELATVNLLLEKTSANNIISKLSLEGRRDELIGKLQSLSARWKKTAEIILYFGGDPVVGSETIRASFAADALGRFQELVSAVYANNNVDLADVGPIPNMKESLLDIAGMPRGSFGFILQERCEAESLMDSNLRTAVFATADLMESVAPKGDGDEEMEIPAVNSRVFGALKNFISLLSKSNASLAIETETKNVILQKEKIKISYDYIEKVTEITSQNIKADGLFKGATGLKRRFDFIPFDQEEFADSLSGLLTKEIDDRLINMMNTEYMDKKCTVSLKKTVTKKSDQSRPSVRWELLDIRPIETPINNDTKTK